MKVIAWIKLSVDELLVTSSENVVSFKWKEGGRKKHGTPFLRKLVLREDKLSVAPSILSVHVLVSEHTLKSY